MANLLEETIEAIQDSGHMLADVAWVGNKVGTLAITWEEFVLLARDLNYDSGYGCQHIASDLVTMFVQPLDITKASGWLERREYDGSEYWEYQEYPELQMTAQPFDRLVSRTLYNTDTLMQANRPAGER